MAATPIESVAGRACVLRGDDIDTDRIIPARFMKVVTFEEVGAHAFEDDRAAAKGDHALDDETYAARASSSSVVISGAAPRASTLPRH